MPFVKLYNKYFYHTTAIILLLMVVSLVMYVYFLNTTVQHVARVESQKRTLQSLTSKVATLEQSYLKGKQVLTLEYAHALGFVDESSPVYVHGAAYVAQATIQRNH
jgi:nitric oxide reductase large subunit